MGRETGRGLYELIPDHLLVGLSCLLSSTDSSLHWHQRLGHPSISKLCQALSGISMSSFECESCQLDKHFWASYPHLDSIPSKSLFDLIHCDVWGHSRVPSILGFSYYIVFVDDFSHASWEMAQMFCPLFINFYKRSSLNILKFLKFAAQIML